MTATANKPTMAEISAQIKREAKEAEAWGTAEGYALKGLKVAKFLSEETTAFSATITKNGVIVGDAQNDGHGGCTMVHAKGLDNKDYGMLETWVDILVERSEEEKWIVSQTKAMAKKGVDFVLFFRTGGSAISVVGDYDDKAKAVANGTKQYGVAPFKVVDLSATSGAVRNAADAKKTEKWKQGVVDKFRPAGVKAVVFYMKGLTLSAKPFRDVTESEEFVKTLGNSYLENVKL